VGDSPCIRPPNILRSTVIGCEIKYELTQKSVKEEFLFEIEVLGQDFSQEKGHTLYNHIFGKFGQRNFFRLPKLGAKAPPMTVTDMRNCA